MDELNPKDHAEALALFRAQVIGPLLCRDPGNHGELAEALRELAAQPVRPPGADVRRYFAASTLERWYYASRNTACPGCVTGAEKKADHSRYGVAIQACSTERELDCRPPCP